MMKQNPIRFIKWVMIVVLACPTSCEKADISTQDLNNNDDLTRQIKSTLISKYQGHIFTPDLSDYNYNVTTKASSHEQFTTSDLLWNKALYYSRDSVNYVAVEIVKHNKTAIFSLYRQKPLSCFKRPVKTFLFYKSDDRTGNADMRVVTMINLNGCPTNPGVFNPIDLSSFIGFIIHSDIDGRFISIKLYDGNKFYSVQLAKPSENNHKILYKLFMSTTVKTKSETSNEEENGLEIQLDELYFVEDKNENKPPQDNEEAEWYDLDGGGHDHIEDMGGEGGGGGSGDQQGETLTLTVTLNASNGGHTSGSGNYQWGETVSIEAIPNLGCRFIQWTEDLSNYGNNHAFSLQLFFNITAMAVFQKNQPCKDATTADPLMNMAIQGTPGNPVNGGRFTALRVRKNKYGELETYQHQGLDLRVEQDTPSFSILEGVIIGIQNIFDPNVPWNKYEEVYGYLGKTTYSAGNMVIVRSYVNGKTIDIVYMHLDNINSNLSVGSTIEPGTVIGVGGSTGAAKSSSSGGPHLHLYVYENGVKKNVENYIYTKFDSNANITRTCNH